VDEAVLVVRGLTKVFGSGPTKVEALRGLDLTLHRGECVAVMGPSGSGKSTLLHLIAGLDEPSAGTVRVAGREVSALGDRARTLLRRQLGLVFQSFHLFDTLSAEENVALPLAIAGHRPSEARARAAAALDAVGLSGRGSHRPPQLSGGEQQRVAVARAVVTDPVLLLADEPTGNLDRGAGARVMELLRGLVGRRGVTLLLVTHDAGHAAGADRVLRLEDGRLIDAQLPVAA
jgi:predicted ABC-type transport system involved in lysophospholipase L1 biosynthesis ATPase subunit